MSENILLRDRQNLNDQLHDLEESGYAYVPNMLNANEIMELRDAIDCLTPIAEANDLIRDPGDEVWSGNTRSKTSIHIKNAFNRDRVFFNCLDRPRVIELAEAALGEDCHIIGMSAWRSGPGRPDQHLHVDWSPIPLPADVAINPRVKIPIFIATAHYYLNDITEELGPTKMIPGSHRAGRTPEENEMEWNGAKEQSVIVNAGDAVMFRSEIWHRGSANNSTKSRYLVQVHYSSRWISQRMPPYLNKFAFDETLLANATPRQLRLLGAHIVPGAYT